MRLPGYALDAVVVAAGLIYAAQTDSYGAFLLATVSLTALAAIGLNVLIGLSGQISFGHVGFMAIGAYATAILMERAGWPFSAAMPAAALLAGAIGGVLAVPALRVRGPYASIIGPNGAGKTTALNLLSGFYRPDSGRVTLDQVELVGLPSHRLARFGLGRTFQTTQLFGHLTPLENVMLAARAGRLGNPLGALGAGRRDRGLAALSRALLAFVGAQAAAGPSA